MIDSRRILTNGVFCPMPWTGLMYNFDGQVKNCIRSSGSIGNIGKNDIQEILAGPVNQLTQERMLQDLPGLNCDTCYSLENNKKRFDIISDRIFYIRELKHTSLDTYQQGRHELQSIDVRWTNLCNFACVYCGPEFSSRWQAELAVDIRRPDHAQLTKFKSYIFDHAAQLKHAYLAGGEPLLMKENLELLDLLLSKNPSVNLRINTNLSKTDTQVFEKICEFKNVHWIVSMESIGDQFEYIRHGGSWEDFQQNLNHIKALPHKITFNMLYFLLNHRGLFTAIDWLMAQGFHANSFVAGALLQPLYLNIRHLPDPVLQSVKTQLMDRINRSPGYLLEDSYRNILHYIDQPFEKNLSASLRSLGDLDQRRGLDSTKIFKELYHLN